MTDSEILKTMARYNQWANRDQAGHPEFQGFLTNHKPSYHVNSHPVVSSSVGNRVGNIGAAKTSGLTRLPMTEVGACAGRYRPKIDPVHFSNWLQPLLITASYDDPP